MGCNCTTETKKIRISKKIKTEVKPTFNTKYTSSKLMVNKKKCKIQDHNDDHSLNELYNDITEASYNSSPAASIRSARTEDVPLSAKWSAWKQALKIEEIYVTEKYEELKKSKAESKWIETIVEDVARTSLSYPYNTEALENILTAYSIYNKEIGYCQGMNYLAGLILIVSDMKEEEAFWAFVSLMEQKLSNEKLQLSGVKKLFAEGFPLAKLLEHLFEAVLEDNDPILKAHLNSIGFYTELWLHKWISSLFLYTFPISYCTAFWDAFLEEGVSFILAITCAILKGLAQGLKSTKTMAECNKIFNLSNGILNEFIPNPEEIISIAKSIKINWKTLHSITQAHKFCVQ